MSGNIIAILDANVLYPSLLRDLLLSLAQQYLYQPKWSVDIEMEWSRNLKKNRPDIDPLKIERIAHEMNRSFKHAKVANYKEIEAELILSDPKDKHVLAAAIAVEGDYIVTFNLKDFDQEILQNYDIEAIHPDTFIVKLINRDVKKVGQAIQKMADRRVNPPVTASELVSRLANNKLTKSASLMTELLNL